MCVFGTSVYASVCLVHLEHLCEKAAVPALGESASIISFVIHAQSKTRRELLGIAAGKLVVPSGPKFVTLFLFLF